MAKSRALKEDALPMPLEGGMSLQLFDNLGLLTIEQVASMLGKRPQTIRNWVARREIPFVPGRPMMFIGTSIVTWLKNREIKPCQ